LSRLALSGQKIAALVEGTRALAREPDLLGTSRLQRELSSSLTLSQTLCPIGVLLIIFESRPDCLIQIASLAIRSGNGVLLKGGKEAHHSNAVLHKIVTQALVEGLEKPCTILLFDFEKKKKKTGGNLPGGVVGLVPHREQVAELLSASGIDLIIPRGSNELVESIKRFFFKKSFWFFFNEFRKTQANENPCFGTQCRNLSYFY
jgi:gamma-glutamyl phosphate reductase